MAFSANNINNSVGRKNISTIRGKREDKEFWNPPMLKQKIIDVSNTTVLPGLLDTFTNTSLRFPSNRQEMANWIKSHEKLSQALEVYIDTMPPLAATRKDKEHDYKAYLLRSNIDRLSVSKNNLFFIHTSTECFTELTHSRIYYKSNFGKVENLPIRKNNDGKLFIQNDDFAWVKINNHLFDTLADLEKALQEEMALKPMRR